MDRISVRGLEVYANHGCFLQEKTLGQKFLINVDLYFDLKAAARDDSIDEAVNYAQICDDITKWMKEKTYNLIETAADVISRNIMKNYDLVKKVVVEIEKPHAPIRHHIDTVIAHVEREKHIAFLSLGSNVGRREDNISDAIEMLKGRVDTKVLQMSGLYETKPYGYTEQDDFINTCVKIETYLEPEQLLKVINMIERSLGRVRDVRWGPRTIDVDIIFYDDLVLDSEDLHIPHIDMQNRFFVLKPLSEIGDYIRHPYLGLTVKELLEKLEKANEGRK